MKIKEFILIQNTNTFIKVFVDFYLILSLNIL